MKPTRPNRTGKVTPVRAAPGTAADKTLRALRRKGAGATDLPTRERLVHAGSDARIETVAAAADAREAAWAPSPHVRIDDGPLARLRVRGLLAPGTGKTQLNAILGDAGERYRAHWYGAGLDGLRSLDISRERVSGGQGGLLRTERQVVHFQMYGRAGAAIPDDARAAVDAIVLHDRDPLDVGRDISGYRQDKQATAVALYVLRGGLTALAVHFGLLRKGA